MCASYFIAAWVKIDLYYLKHHCIHHRAYIKTYLNHMYINLVRLIIASDISTEIINYNSYVETPELFSSNQLYISCFQAFLHRVGVHPVKHQTI